MMPMRSVHGVELYYEVHGTSGDPMVLVHGSWVDHHTWDLVVPGFARGLEVVTYDRRSHGESASGPRPHPVRDDAADLAGLLEGLNIYPAHIVSHSYGGAVALRLAIDRPEMVRSIAIHEAPFLGLLSADPATAAEGAAGVARVREFQRLVRTGERERAAEQVAGAFSTDPGAWKRLPPSVRDALVARADQWAEEFDDPEALLPNGAALRELMVPTLLTEGSESPPFLHRITRYLSALLPNSLVLEIPGAGHVPHLVRPDQYVGLLLTFLLERNVPVS
jgi:pimeloyl-ACP methyl ester carboxylesterase